MRFPRTAATGLLLLHESLALHTARNGCAPISHVRWPRLSRYQLSQWFMTDEELLEQAERCRRQALAYVGRPEGTFLLQAAAAFEALARQDPKRQR